MRRSHFVKAYIQTALWSTNDESTPSGGEPLENNYTVESLSDKTRANMVRDCDKFCDILEGLCKFVPDFDPYGSESRAGHDFWLTRNHHGAGFWDGDWPPGVGERLTQACRLFPEVNLYVGMDEKIYDG